MATSGFHIGKTYTILGAKKLNYCVRHGNRWVLLAIITTHYDIVPSKLNS